MTTDDKSDNLNATETHHWPGMLTRAVPLPSQALTEDALHTPAAIVSDAVAKELLRRDWLTAYQVNQIMQGRAEDNWRKFSDLVLTPSVRTVQWDGFGDGPDLIRAGQAAALEALPRIQAWIDADQARASRPQARDLEPA